MFGESEKRLQGFRHGRHPNRKGRFSSLLYQYSIDHISHWNGDLVWRTRKENTVSSGHLFLTRNDCNMVIFSGFMDLLLSMPQDAKDRTCFLFFCTLCVSFLPRGNRLKNKLYPKTLGKTTKTSTPTKNYSPLLGFA